MIGGILMSNNYETPNIIGAKALDNYLIYLIYETKEEKIYETEELRISNTLILGLRKIEGINIKHINFNETK